MQKINAKACIGIIAIFLVLEVRSSCYVIEGCNPPEGVDPLLEEWSPTDESCTNCHCQYYREDIGTCSDFYYSVKKSTDGYFVESEEEVEVVKEDAESVTCSNTISWKYDEAGNFIMPTGLKHTTYFYYDTSTECCSTSTSYGGVPPGCIEIKTDECTSKVVVEEDPSKPCVRPGLYYVG